MEEGGRMFEVSEGDRARQDKRIVDRSFLDPEVHGGIKQKLIEIHRWSGYPEMTPAQLAKLDETVPRLRKEHVKDIVDDWTARLGAQVARQRNANAGPRTPTFAELVDKEQGNVAQNVATVKAMGGKQYEGSNVLTAQLANIEAQIRAAALNEKHPEVGSVFANFARRIQGAPDEATAAKVVLGMKARLSNPKDPGYAAAVKATPPMMRALIDQMAAQVQTQQPGWFDTMKQKWLGIQAPPTTETLARPLSATR